MFLKKLTWLLFWVLSFLQTKAQTFSLAEMPVLRLNTHRDSIHLRPYILTVADTAENFNYSSVFEKKGLKLQSLQETQLSYDKRYWYGFRVKNETNDTIQKSFNFDLVYAMTFHAFVDGAMIDSATSAIKLKPHRQKNKIDFPSNRTLLLTFLPQKETTVWVSLKKRNAPFLENPILFHLKSESGFFFSDLLKMYLWNGIFLSMLLLMMFWAGINYYVQQKKAFVFYFLYILSHFVFYFNEFQYYEPFRYYLIPRVYDYKLVTILGTNWIIFNFLFLDSFFDKEIRVKLRKWLKMCIYVCIVFFAIDRFLVAFLDTAGYVFTIYTVKKFLTAALSCIALFGFFYLKNEKNAYFIVLGTLFFAIGSAIMRFSLYQYLIYDYNYLGQQIGIILELICFSIALAQKNRLDSEEKNKSQARLYSLRTNVSQDLHDDIGATLSSIQLLTEVLKRKVSKNDTEILSLLDKVAYNARVSIDKMRDMVWVINAREDTLSDLTQRIKEMIVEKAEPLEINCHFDINVANLAEMQLESNTKKMVYFTIKEAVNNALKYSQTDKIFFSAKEKDSRTVILILQDFGNGFDLENTKMGNGLYNMRSRSESIKAKFDIFSDKNGTKIVLEVNI